MVSFYVNGQMYRSFLKKTKIIDVRLNDVNFNSIKPGDAIYYMNCDTPSHGVIRYVKVVKRFTSFEKAFQNVNIEDWFGMPITINSALKFLKCKKQDERYYGVIVFELTTEQPN